MYQLHDLNIQLPKQDWNFEKHFGELISICYQKLKILHYLQNYQKI